MEMVCGFMFDPRYQRVALIEKSENCKIVQLRGKLNGIGGKIEPGETELEAMIREFWEETGVEHHEWEHYLTMHVGPYLDFDTWKYDNVVHFFRTATNDVDKVKTMETEPVNTYYVDDLLYDRPHAVVPNLRWHLPLAREMGLIQVVKVFVE
jgi:8-oxo-dGTP diphosphatase